MLNTVVVIDDSETDLLFARIMLERAGIAGQLLLFGSAQEALVHLQGEQAAAVDLILLDINMPVMDGFEFLDALDDLGRQGRRRPPVVMLSSSPDPADRVRALHHACVHAYVTKPMDLALAASLPARLQPAATG